MSKLWLSFYGIKGSGNLGQAELYPDYWNFKIILGIGQHIFNKVLKSRIRMYGSLYLIKSQSTTKSNKISVNHKSELMVVISTQNATHGYKNIFFTFIFILMHLIADKS